MGLFGALNKMSGYSAENMNKVFDEFLPVMDSKAICPIGISLKAKGLFSSKPIASGFATITDTSLFVIYTMIPIKGVAIYDFRNAKRLVIRNQIANQKVIDAKLLNLRTQEFEDVCLQTAPKINGFPQQESNAYHFKAVSDRIKNKTASAPEKGTDAVLFSIKNLLNMAQQPYHKYHYHH